MIIMGMALLYAVLRLDGNPDKCGVDWCAAAIDDVEKCQAYLRSFCKGECCAVDVSHLPPPYLELTWRQTGHIPAG